MTLDDAGQWRALRALVAELLDLAPAERAARLATLSPDLAAEVGALLAGMDGEVPDRFERGIAGFAGVLLADWERQAADDRAGEAATLAGNVLGAWRLESLLGRGGMAEVWEAHRVAGDFEQVVAVKLLKRGMDSEEIVGRFLRERQILARLDHPGIARLFDGGIAPDGRPYFVMEKVDGEPITEWCEKRSVPLADRLRLLIACCTAVAAAHRLLVVHRDLKPSNILVTAGGAVKLLDFGIAKLLEDDSTGGEATRTEQRLLTPAYAAPEQILGEPVTTATDVYALGVVAYELLTGRLPHRRRGADLASAVASEVVERPSSAVLEIGTKANERPGAARDRRRRARTLAGDLDTIELTALRREPERRYPTVAAFADDLQRYLDGRPIAARRDSVRYRARKFVGRNRWAVTAAILTLVALVTALGLALRQADRAAAAARRAEHVQRFLVEVFRKAEPGESLGETLTAKQILDEGVSRISSELEGEPAVAADLYDALAEIHERLGLVPRATELAERALELRDHRLPLDVQRLGATLSRLASLRLDGTEPLSALPIAERAWSLLSAHLGGESLDAAAAEAELASVLLLTGRVDEGVDRSRHALAVFRAEAGPNDVRTAEREGVLAAALERAGKYDEALATYESSIPRLAGALGPRHPEVSYARRDLASLLDRMGHSAEAEPQLVSALADLRAVLGDHHWQVGQTLFSYAILLNSSGRLREGEGALREALAIEGPALFRAHCLRYLGINLADQGRFAEAAVELAAAVAEYRRIEGDDSIEAWRAAASLGFAHLREGEAGQAESELAQAVQRLEVLAGPASYPVRQPLRQLGEALRVQGKTAAAIATLRRTRALEVELFGTEDHRDIALTDRQLALALAAVGQPKEIAEALHFADEAVTLCRKHRPQSGPLGEALLDRGNLRLARGERAAAGADFEEAAVLLGHAYGDQDGRTLAARRALAALAG